MSCLCRTKTEPSMAGDSDKCLKRASTAIRPALCLVGLIRQHLLLCVTSSAWPAAENSPGRGYCEPANAIPLQTTNQPATEYTGGPSWGCSKATLFWQSVWLPGCDSIGVCLIPVCCLTNGSDQPRTVQDCGTGWTRASALFLHGVGLAPADCS